MRFGRAEHTASDDFSEDDETDVAEDLDDTDDDEREPDESEENIDVQSKQEASPGDDPVHTYLVQMGEIPLLKRDEEIRIARRIDATRLRYRNYMLSNDFVLRQSAHKLAAVTRGEL